jgi:mannose-6-phosphate isomerase-like protein (cupin superfamily)
MGQRFEKRSVALAESASPLRENSLVLPRRALDSARISQYQETMKIILSSEKAFIPASHENPLAPGVWKKILFQRAELMPGTVQMINWARLPAGSSFSAHYHEDMQEIFIIVAGEAEMVVAGETVLLGRGDTIAIDPREIHRMTNRGNEDVEYVVLGITANQGGKTVVVS